MEQYSLPGAVLGSEFKENTRDIGARAARIFNTEPVNTIHLGSVPSVTTLAHYGPDNECVFFFTEGRLAVPGGFV